MSKDFFMLCESVTEQEAEVIFKFDYIAQEKKDGNRCIAVVKNNDVFLVNRRGRIINNNFPEIEAELKKLDNCILDGEICSRDDKFENLQRRALTKNKSKIEILIKEIPVTYWIFDLLSINNKNITRNSLKERIEFLNNFLKDKQNEFIKILPFESIKDSLREAHKKNGEGIVIKDLRCPYEHRRSPSWVKCKFFKEATIILTKYTENPAGIRAETEDGIAVQIAGEQHKKVKEILDSKKSCEIFIQYLSKNEATGKYRFPSYRGLVNGI